VWMMVKRYRVRLAEEDVKGGAKSTVLEVKG
jgi:hypothetical protein